MTPTPLAGVRLGVATASTQIEGELPPSNWTDWAARGRILDGTHPNPATDHWNRWREDAQLLADLGIRDYRLSIDWARLEPAPGQYDHAALEHYRAELDLLRGLGVTPLVTLHHFSNPLWAERAGSWRRDETAAAFRRFACWAVRELRDLVEEWVTFNEPNVYATYGYGMGLWPPGWRNRPVAAELVARRMGTTHRRLYRDIHELQPDAKVGIAHHIRGFQPLRRFHPIDQVTARVCQRLFNEVPFTFAHHGSDPRADFLGLNYYTASVGKCGSDIVDPRLPHTDLGWSIRPEGMLEALSWLHERYPGLPLWITENGCCDRDDRFRARFIYDHLAPALRSELPVERYYHWCFVDNWEWAEGRGAPFGLVELDWATQERRLRPSAEFYAGVISAQGFTDQLLETYVAQQEYPQP